MMKKIEIVFTSATREITREKNIILEIGEDVNYQDIVELLAHRYPDLVGTLISNDHRSFLSANLFSRNAEEPIMPGHMAELPADGDRLVIVNFIVGGSVTSFRAPRPGALQ